MTTTEAAPCWVIPSLVSDDPHFPTRGDAEQAAPEWGARPHAEQLAARCVLARCGGCGEVYDQHAESMEYHFRTEQEARRDATVSGWSLADDGSLRCRHCKPNPVAMPTYDQEKERE